MKYILPSPLLILIMIMVFQEALPQSNPPWERPLKMAWSQDGTIFTNNAIFQDSSGVPSIVKWKGDTIICIFQWFRQPVNSSTWDKVAVKFSYNAGVSWTKPKPILVNGLPVNYQRPFDPSLAVINKDSLRVYFSSSDGMPSGGLSPIVNTYSAISKDGISYTYEPNPRFDHPDKPAIDPTVIFFNGTWHYSAQTGTPLDGVFHCTSLNGLNFTQQVSYSSDFTHYWLGNFMLNSPTELRFYGSGKNIWFNTSSDGFIWKGYMETNITGGDPSAVKIGNSNYLVIYTGEAYITGKVENGFVEDEIKIYPNPITDYISISLQEGSDYKYSIFSVSGKIELAGEMTSGNNISTSWLNCGVYILQIENKEFRKNFKIVK